MTIVATVETRNAAWANDQSSFGRKMLAKMGWKGDGLGKNQQGTSTHLRAVKRADSLGIGAENDAFGDKGWADTNKGFHGVLANLKAEYGSEGGSDSDDKEARKKRRKEEKKRKKREEKRRAKLAAKGDADGSGSDTAASNNGLRLAQNKVQAGHARKMREAKDIRNKSAADMAAIFGVKADFYKQPRDWVQGGGGDDDDGSSDKKKEDSVESTSDEVEQANKKNKKPKKKSSKDDKKKRKRSSDGNEGKYSESLDDCKKRKKDKSKK